MAKKKMFAIAALLVLALAACQPAAAADYGYVSAGATAVDVRDVSADGYFGEASVELGENFFVRTGYTNGTDTDLELGTAKVGIGFHDEMTKNTDLYGIASALVVVDDRTTFDKYTYELEFGLRNQLTNSFELRGGVIVGDVSNSPEYLGTVGLEFAVTEAIRIGADIRGKEDVLGGQLGVRLYF